MCGVGGCGYVVRKGVGVWCGMVCVVREGVYSEGVHVCSKGEGVCGVWVCVVCVCGYGWGGGGCM